MRAMTVVDKGVQYYLGKARDRTSRYSSVIGGLLRRLKMAAGLELSLVSLGGTLG